MAKNGKAVVVKSVLKSTTLTLRLLKEGCDVESALRDDHNLSELDSSLGRLFIGQSQGVQPTWASFVSQFSSNGLPALENKHCSAVLFLDVASGKVVKTRTFAISFGGGHHCLDANQFERNFGLRVTLNSVARGNLRNLDTATLDSTSFQKRIQSSRKADLQGFGINVESDLLRLAGGVPTDTSFASALTGRDALTITTKTSASDLMDKCKTALNLYNSDAYKKDFDFIDYIVPVRDASEIENLDALVFEELRKLIDGKDYDLHIALPEVVSSEEVYEIGYFGVGLKSGSKTGYSEVAIEDYVEEIKAGRPNDINNMADLKAGHEIRVMVDGEGSKYQKKRVYDCFIYEVDNGAGVHVLFGGEWYRVEKSFRDTVERDFNKLLSMTPFISATTAKDERTLISDLDKRSDLLNLDQVKISPAGTTNAHLEPCDFLSRTKQFIHLKDGHSSAPISHLWNQGVVSAESFVRDSGFRAELRRKAIDRQRKTGKIDFETLLPDGRSKAVPSDYTVVFGIMRAPHKRSKALGLPFFSKVSLRPVAERIKLMGFPVEVHLIEKQ